MPVIDATLKPFQALELLIEECSPDEFLEITGRVIARKVKSTMQCYVTGKTLAHEAICSYCNRCPAGRWFKVEMERKRS